MKPALAAILQLLELERIEADLFRGQNDDSEHVFGGQVLAQAVRAAYETVPRDRALHSLHAYFLRPGDWRRPILFEVDRIRDGRSFTTRRVVAIQHGRAIFNLASSWQVEESGLEHAVAAPDVARPETLPSERDRLATMKDAHPHIEHFLKRYDAIDSRQVEDITLFDSGRHEPWKHTWMRATERLPDERWVHWCLLAWMSDMDFMSTSMLPHGRMPGPDSNIQGASIDHALWFHRPFRVDEWLLFAKESPNACGARGYVRGQFHDEGGRLVVSAAQECLIRPRAPAQNEPQPRDG